MNYTLGKKLKQLRIRNNWNQDEVATKLQLATSTYGLYEQDRRSPGYDTLIAISKLYNISIDELLGNNINIPVHEKKMLLKTLLSQTDTSVMFADGSSIDELDDITVDSLLEELASFLDVKVAMKSKR